MEYDPLLAKLIGYGETRKQAIGRLKRALQEYSIGGVRTNLRLFQQILSDNDFAAARTDTGYLARLAERSEALTSVGQEIAAIAAAIFSVLETGKAGNSEQQVAQSTWKKIARTEALS
jgi:acetyl-CoA carboxylase biotin carboxylase subunit